MKRLALTLILLSIHTAWAQSYRCMVRTPVGWGYIDEKGQFIIKPSYFQTLPFSSGLALVQKITDGPYYFVKPDGSLLNTMVSNYSVISYGIELVGYRDGRVAIKADGKWGYMNTEGRLTTTIIYDKVSEWGDGAGAVKLKKDWIIIDEGGNQFPVQSKEVKLIKHFSDGLAPFVASNGKTGFINMKGEVAILPQYENTGYFYGGLAWARSSNIKVGFINKSGRWVLPPDFLEVRDFDPVSKMVRVKTETGWTYLNEQGNALKMDLEGYGDFSEGLCAGKQKGKWGFFDKNGTWVIKPQFNGIRDFKNGFAAAEEGNDWGIIDTTGKWLIKPTYNSIKDMEKVD